MQPEDFDRYLQGADLDTPALAYLGQHSHLLPLGVDALAVAEHFAGLVQDQDARLAAGDIVSPIPLLWVALAQSAGLVIDVATGRIIDGPRAQLPVFVAGGDHAAL